MERNQQKLSLNSDNLVLKGSNLRNTDFIYGIVVYTGHHTKVMMNSAKPRRKISDLEAMLNKSILIILGAQFILSIIGASIGTSLAYKGSDNVKWLMSNI